MRPMSHFTRVLTQPRLPWSPASLLVVSGAPDQGDFCLLISEFNFKLFITMKAKGLSRRFKMCSGYPLSLEMLQRRLLGTGYRVVGGSTRISVAQRAEMRGACSLDLALRDVHTLHCARCCRKLF
ncbi:unnamed protein product [Arctogadus glacialis]